MKKAKKKIFKKFAKYYDEIYNDKDYKKETEEVVRVLKKYDKTSKKILDFGCGTGKHSVIFAKKGYNITGIDQSSTVIEIAKKRFEDSNLTVKLLTKNITSFKTQEKFDACISLFSTFCYLKGNTEVAKALKNIKNSLKTNGLFIFDFWNAISVINEKPSTKVKFIESKSQRIIRIAIPEMDFKNHICTIKYHCIVLKNKLVIDEFVEEHKIRYYFPKELKNILKKVGFEILELRPMFAKNTIENEEFLKNWYLLAITRKR